MGYWWQCCATYNLWKKLYKIKQGAKKIIFTACHLGKLKLALTSSDIINFQLALKAFLTSRIALMHVYVTQANFTTKPRFEIKNKRSFTEIPKAVELKRVPTHKKCKCKKFCSQTRLVGEIYSSDVIMHRGYWFHSSSVIQIPQKTSLARRAS